LNATACAEQKVTVAGAVLDAAGKKDGEPLAFRLTGIHPSGLLFTAAPGQVGHTPFQAANSGDDSAVAAAVAACYLTTTVGFSAPSEGELWLTQHVQASRSF
jgi:hypothetical protein